MQHSGGADPTVAPTVSHELLSSKHKSSSLAAPGWLPLQAWRSHARHHASPFTTHARPAAEGRAPLEGWTLVLLAAGISLATILVRPVFTFDSGQIGNLKLWQWATYLGMFGLGIIAVQRGGLDPVPDRIRRRCGQTVLLSLVALGLMVGAIALAGYSTNVTGRGLHLAPTLFAAIEGPMVVGMCVWLLAFCSGI